MEDKSLDQEARKSIGNAVAVKPQEAKEISKLLDALSMATANLEDNVSELSLALTSVKRNEPSTDQGIAEHQASTDIGQFLSMLISRVDRVNNTVRDNRDKLEI